MDNVHAFIGCFLSFIFIDSVCLRVENNLYCCTWFLMRLKETLKQDREISFITNMDDVVSSCIDHVFPDFYHGYTSKSVFKYMHTRGISDRTLEHFFWMTTNSYIVSNFEENFRWLNPDAREVLANIGHVKWAKAYFPNIRWNVINIDVPKKKIGVSSKSAQCTDYNAYRENS
uniref:Protein FAR1-RELATED SEQUENCE n=1 Tax=Lactuca sativa TaxID=4236 RepID=A0A9R1UIK7_LACSA|nr:hypothetical protein LSAT_V11C900472720 [Lactuca sativa]